MQQRTRHLTKAGAVVLLAAAAVSYITIGDSFWLAREARSILAGFGVQIVLANDTDPESEPESEADPAEVAIGERLFLETRFAQFFFANSNGDANAVLPTGDPAVDFTVTPTTLLPGPFAGASMNCRSCHLVDEQSGVSGGGNRTYADFARRSPVPQREDGKLTTARNSPPLVNASIRRRNFLLHFDGEFTSPEELVRATFTGRNFGWLAQERHRAQAHIAHIIRNDDGKGALARDFGGAYRVVLKGTDPSIPPELRLPPRFRIDVRWAADEEILDAVAKLVGAYLRQLLFAQDESGNFSASPYDVFLRKNALPTHPAKGESDVEYSRRLLKLVEKLHQPRFVSAADGNFELHDQAFVFGPLELQGLKTFLREPKKLPLTSSALAEGGIGNCIACHAAPNFTDFSFHNTGAAQDEFDSIHGDGALAALHIPDLHTRNANFNAFLPPTARHPRATGPFLDIPSVDRPGATDLGLWNVFANPDIPGPQGRIRNLLCRNGTPCVDRLLLDQTIATFKTPGLRDLGHSGPYLHTGRADALGNVIGLYAKFSNLAREGKMRNADPLLESIALKPSDGEALVAFLKSLNEDYD
jgi:hypothetical protein